MKGLVARATQIRLTLLFACGICPSHGWDELLAGGCRVPFRVIHLLSNALCVRLATPAWKGSSRTSSSGRSSKRWPKRWKSDSLDSGLRFERFPTLSLTLLDRAEPFGNTDDNVLFALPYGAIEQNRKLAQPRDAVLYNFSFRE